VILSNVKDTLHAYICYQLFITPLIFPIDKKYRPLLNKAKSHMDKICSKKITLNHPKHHVIHCFTPKGKVKGTILINHGWMSKSLYMMGIIDALYTQGYCVYAMDFPAHGESKGFQLHWYESVDAIININNTLGPFDAAIGHSYGGSMLLCALCLSEYHTIIPFEKLILIASPTVMTTPIKRMSKFLRLNPNAHKKFRTKLHQSHDIDIKQLNIYKQLDKHATQFLALHGIEDNAIPYHESINLCNNCPSAQLKLFDKLNHIDIIFNKGVYDDIITFIQSDSLWRNQKR
jgi:predicted alpha/beta-fold hydrolase